MKKIAVLGLSFAVLVLSSCQVQTTQPLSVDLEISQMEQLANLPIDQLVQKNNQWQEVHPNVWVLNKGSEDGLQYRRVKIENSPQGMNWAVQNIHKPDIEAAKMLIANATNDEVRQRLQSRLGFLRSTVSGIEVSLQKIKSQSESLQPQNGYCATANATAMYTSAARGAKAYASVSGCVPGQMTARAMGSTIFGLLCCGQQNSDSGPDKSVGAAVYQQSGGCSSSSSASNWEGDSDSDSSGCGQQ
jgi:hypothetical protein